MSEPSTHADDVTAPEGRLFVLTGPGADDVARALAATLPRAASVDGAVVEAMFAGEDGIAPSDTRSELERRYLRYTAGIALADSFRLAGYDAVVAEDVPPDHLEAYLDFADPAPVHLVRLTGAHGAPDDTENPPGLLLPGTDPHALATQIVAHADGARIDPPPGEAGPTHPTGHSRPPGA